MGFLGASLSYLVFSAIHIVQFALAIAVCALYGIDLHRASSHGKYIDSKWVYAEVVGGLSAFTAVLYLVPFILRFWLVWAWNAILFILWIALFGVFGSMYIHEDPEGDAGVQRMKNTVWLDLVNALLWLITFLGALGYWLQHRERHSRFTGRAKV